MSQIDEQEAVLLDELERRAFNLRVLLSATFVVMLLGIVAMLLQIGEQPRSYIFLNSMFLLFAALILALCYYLSLRGRVQAGSVIFTVMMMLACIGAIVVGGTRGALPVILVIPIVSASITLGVEVSLALATLSVVVLVTTGLLERGSILKVAYSAPEIVILMNMFDVGFSLFFIILSIWLAGYSLRQSLQRAQKEIGERVRAEDALRESEEKYRDLVENVSDVIYTVDTNGVITYVSPAVESFIGYHASEVIGRSFAELIHQEDLQRTRESLEKIFAGHSPGPSEYRILDKSGAVRWMRTSSRPIFENDRVVEVQGVLADITERKRTEEELKRYREHLEELVEERTRELEKAQAELLRRERLSALGQLTATVAHEIRNPLGTVSASVFAINDAIEQDETFATLAQGRTMERIRRGLELAERNVVRCDNIISELLDYTCDRILQLEPTDIDAWLEALLDEQVIPEGIVCTRDLTAGIDIPIDREHLRRAVINVLDNAIDALQDEEAEGNRLTVGAHVVANRLEIRFSDTGCGISPEVLTRIFEPLFSTKSFGVGLGLPIVKDIMEQHGGGVEIESPIDVGRAQTRGTTVTLWLPMSIRESEAEGGGSKAL